MVQVLPANPTKRSSFLESLGTGISQAVPAAVEGYFQKKQQAQQMAQENEQLKKMGMDLSGISDPKMRQIAFSQMLEQQGKQSLQKQENENVSRIIGDENNQRNPGQFNLENLPDNKLRALLPHKTYGPIAKNILSSRNQGGIKAKPTPPEVGEVMEKVIKEYPDASPDELMVSMDKEGVPRIYSDSFIESRRRSVDTEAKREESRYGLQKDFINDTTSRYSAFETDMKPKLLQMQNIPDADLISPTTAVFLDALGIPLGALEDPSSELYQKLSLDLLKGLPETFGNRILKVEVDNFLKTIPQLTNSPEGRRMIASNILKLGEMKEVYYNEMRKQQSSFMDSGKPLPLDFQQRVFDQVKPQINKVNNEFSKLSEIKSVPKDTIPFFNPNGDIEFVPKQHAQWAESNGGKRIW